MQVNLEVDDAVGRDRVGEALDPDLAARLAMDLVLHMGEGLVRDQDAAGRRLVLEPRGEVHGAADDGVVHAVLAAEIADRAIAGVDADAAAQRRLDAGVAPGAGELADALLHGERHRDAGERVLLDAAALGVAEEHHDCVADIFVDRRAVLERDLRHLGQVVVEELGQVLGFHLVGGLGEAGDVGEADRQLLALARDGDVLAAGEDRVVDLRRQVLGELARERLERRRFLRQVGLALLELGDVRVDRDRAAVLGAALTDHDPAAVAAPLHLRLAGIAVLREALRYPFLDPALGVLDGALRGRAPDDAPEGHARRHGALVARIEQPAIARVAQHEAVLGVVEDEALRDALDRLDEALLAEPAGVLGRLQRGDVVDPQHALAAGEADVTAVIGDLDIGQEDVHRLALLRLPDHLLVQELAAAFAQAFDDATALVEVVPEASRVEERQLVGVIAEQLA